MNIIFSQANFFITIQVIYIPKKKDLKGVWKESSGQGGRRENIIILIGVIGGKWNEEWKREEINKRGKWESNL